MVTLTRSYAAGPTPTFADEFLGSSLSAVWVPFNPPGDPGDRMDTDMMGDLSQVSVAGGIATITCQLKTTPSGRPYAGANMCTFGTFSQLYGTFEARIQYPAGQGIWPAFWLLAATGKTTPPEIDVFESYPADPATGGGGSGVNVFIPALHTTLNPSRYAVITGANMTTAYHVHRIIWSATQLEYFLDGVSTFLLTTDVPQVAMYPILTYGIGAPGFRADGTTPTTSTMLVDYVRIWP